MGEGNSLDGRDRPHRLHHKKRFKVHALKNMQEVEDEVLGFLNFTYDAINTKHTLPPHRKVGAQKRAEMLRHPCILGDPQ